MVVPQAHDKNHSLGKSIAHALHATKLIKSVTISKYLFLVVAEFLRDAVAFVAFNGRLAVRNNFAVLNVESLDLLERRTDELGDDSKLLACVDGFSFSVEVLVSLTIGVEIATISVANTGISSRRVRST